MNILAKFRPPFTHYQRGVAAVELAILLIPLVMLLFGVVEYGRAIYQYNTLAKSVRDTARYLSTVTAGTGHTEAINLVMCGYTGSCKGMPPVVPYLLPSMVKICDKSSITDCPGIQHDTVNTGEGSINLVTVKVVGYVYHPIFPSFTVKLFSEQVTVGLPGITFGPISNMMRQPL